MPGGGRAAPGRGLRARGERRSLCLCRPSLERERKREEEGEETGREPNEEKEEKKLIPLFSKKKKTSLRSSEKVMALPCGHLFHSNCVSDWLERHATCPECRTEITSSLISALGDDDIEEGGVGVGVGVGGGEEQQQQQQQGTTQAATAGGRRSHRRHHHGRWHR